MRSPIAAAFLLVLAAPVLAATVLAAGEPATLRFDEMYRTPVGPAGLEPTARLLSLQGQRIRISGFMVRTETPTVGTLILAPSPLEGPHGEDGPADDLPPQIVHVHFTRSESGAPPAWTPQRLTYEGRLELGPLEEADGRVSHVRVYVDAPIPVSP